MVATDRDIVSELKNSTPLGARLICNKYQNYLYHVAYKSLSNRQEAVSVVDDTLMQAVKKISAFEFKGGENDFRNWLFTICYNRVRDILRSRSSKEAVVVLSLDETRLNRNGKEYNPVQHELDKTAAREYETEPVLEDSPELRKLTREYLEKLPEKKRFILEGCIRGLPHKEIAEMVGIPPEQVKVNFYRLKLQFKEYILSKEGKG